MKILCTTSSFNRGLISDEYEVILNPYNRKLTEEEVYELINKHQPIAMIAGIEPLTREVMKKANNLKIISRCGIGLDSVDLAAAEELGIKVTNTPDGPTLAVAELTLGLILNLIRNIHVSDKSIREDEWERPMGSLLNKKTIGIIGCGRIGTTVGKLLKAFGCRVLGYDKYLKDSDVVELVSLERLLTDSNIVTLHIPYTDETHHIIGQNEISKMNKGVYIVNTSRGGLIDEDALLENLKNGSIRGAALDCFENEPYAGPLKDLKNVILTAHIGSYAQEARLLQEEQAVENVIVQLRKLGVVE